MVFGKVFAQDGNKVFLGADGERIVVYFFHSNACPHCISELAFLDEMLIKYPQIEIKAYDMSNPESQRLYQDFGGRLKLPEQAIAVEAIPFTIINDRYFLGFMSRQTTGAEIEDFIKSQVLRQTPSVQPRRSQVTFFGQTINIGLKTPLSVMAVVFGLGDGINPCMFSVFLMLLAYLFSTQTPKRTIMSGLLFAFCVFIIYFSLMVGIYKSLAFFNGMLANIIGPIKVIFGVIFVAVGAWMAKDYFFLKKGRKISFAIPKIAHPMIKKLASQSSFAAVIVLALFSSLVELPCTFALPLGYTTILAENSVFPYPYLFLYNLMFVVPLFIIVGLVGLGFSKIEKLEDWREKTKKKMRLISGLLLLLLGATFLLKVF